MSDGSVADPGDRAPAADADGDGIGDDWEGRDLGTDTDADGTPDYLDSDSDGDGIPDSVERVSGGGDRQAIDSDGDGIPDFRDTDSDANGMPDMVEGTGDADGDGVPDYRDLDDDNDSVRDAQEIGDPSEPTDTDGDGMPDFRDFDSDDDSIGDGWESLPPDDTDGDGIRDRHDLDSDNDGFSDLEEAGPPERDPTTAPVDTDEDGIPDFRDPDSDNDGLSDSDERLRGSNPRNADTDGDGVTDLVEVGACREGDTSCASDVTDPGASPRTRGDFVFFEPYMMAPDPAEDTLVFSTNLQIADVYFLMDTTGSMGPAITSLRSSIAAFIPNVRLEIPNVWVGVGDYRDYPVSPYGASGDFAYQNHQSITGDEAAAVAATSRYAPAGGADSPESLIPALWSIATGTRLGGTSGMPATRPGEGSNCPADTFGYPCFRDGAVPIVVAITDVRTHNGPDGLFAYDAGIVGAATPTWEQTIDELRARNIRVIGVGQRVGGRNTLEALSTATGAVDGTGAPLYSAVSGSIGDSVLDQIRTLANSTPLDISVVFEDDPTDAVDTLAAFVDHLVVNNDGEEVMGRRCTVFPAGQVRDTDGDTYADTIENVTPGQPVCFDVVVKQNDTVMPTSSPQVFRGTIRVLGDGFTELDRRDVFFLVPPVIEVPVGPE